MARNSSFLAFLAGAFFFALLQLAFQEFGSAFSIPSARVLTRHHAVLGEVDTVVPSIDGQAGQRSRSLLQPAAILCLLAVVGRTVVATAQRKSMRASVSARSSHSTVSAVHQRHILTPVANCNPVSVKQECEVSGSRPLKLVHEEVSDVVAAAFVGQRMPAAQRQATALAAKKSVEDLGETELKGKKVLIRCDLNVPLNSDLQITDETRITASVPTIKYLCDKGAKVIACSHLGRPKEGPEEKFSLKPVAKRMGEIMDKDIKCAPDCKATDEVKSLVEGMAEGDVVILENTRFYKGETKNDSELAESMASLADLFVNDAFGTAHRAHSSTEGVTQFLKPCVSGFLLKKELDYLKGAIDEPKKPMAAIVGGAKVSTKIPVIESMLDKVDKLIIGGGMVFTFFKARGLSVGNSLVEEDMVELAKSLEEKAKAKGVELILPKDIACGDAFPGDGKEVGFKVVPADAIPDGWLGLDNGPEATEEIKAALADCNTVIWNGPMGVFESSQFAKGTYDIAECLAELTEKNGAITIIGGGDSVSAVNKSGLADKMSHISTGGGASLELLEGKVLPGVAALDDA